MPHELATFAAGCFWGVEAKFMELPGVVSTRVGYTGGHTEHPTYEQVCSKTTGHAEAVEVTYDPKEISYGHLLHVFWSCHDPTQLNRQGPDVGAQYRSAIFTHSHEQQAEAEASKTALEASGKFSSPIVTQIQPSMWLYPAEAYHQQYYKKHPLRHC
ncbi:MAG: peptide-methionine (S)-S-oxide reductase MsrA [Vampirovibrionales bacterium]|nr:peptide-methionine (S)-S-oxide reductase MsrA [Vampirovibrionales bacterium]